MPHNPNWYAGWSLLLAAFLTGALLGLFFTRDDFLGGYFSWPRRLLRLGHISLAALGILNILYSLAPLPGSHAWQPQAASLGLIVGGISMPLACFLAAWNKKLKPLFAIPIASLVTPVVLVLMN